jgi:hypothetical protein
MVGISKLEDLQNRQSAQGLAVDWIVNDDAFGDTNGLTVSDIKFIQRYVLAVFYFVLGGDLWGVCHRADTSCSAGRWQDIQLAYKYRCMYQVRCFM